VSHPTLPGDRPRWAVATVRVVQAVLAVLALAALALTAMNRPAAQPRRLPAGPVLVVTGTTLRPPAYAPRPAGPPCPVPQPQKASR
jgi:hypothetical protein